MRIVRTKKGFYRFAWIFCKIIFKLLFRLKVEGEEHVPSDRGVVLVCNHISLLDPPVVGTATSRELNYLAKAELFEHPVLRWIITGLNALPVKRESVDKDSLQKMLGLLRRNEALLLFPEGTRSKEGNLGRAKLGVGMLALKTAVPIVPVHISGAKTLLGTLLGKDRIWVKFGRPLYPEKLGLGTKRRDDYKLVVQQVMFRIESLGKEKQNLNQARR